MDYSDSDDDEFNTKSQRQGLNSLFREDHTSLQLLPDASARPLWVCVEQEPLKKKGDAESATYRIILEAFSPLRKQAEDFLVTIAEPVTRPMRIHEYKMTLASLYAGISVGMTTDVILKVFERFSKTKNFVKIWTASYGKASLVLKHGRYYIESSHPDILRKLLKDDVIKAARINEITRDGENVKVEDLALDDDDDDSNVDEEGESEFTSSFEIKKKHLELVKKRCMDLRCTLRQEYDFRQDRLNADLDIDLSPKTVIRDYQEKCLSKMFGGGLTSARARSGIIVLPTGAGKTLVGITAACTVKKSTMILCTNALSVEQWAVELKKWSTINDRQIAKFTANNKEKFPGDAGIVITTYTMIAHQGKRALDTQQMIEFVNGHEWGLMILDEVHVVPANVFRKVFQTVSAHTYLGLTATLVREDDKIEDLNFLIGPKLYEANWMDLADRGHIAKVECTEIWCPIPGDFYKLYTNSSSGKRRLICAVNPSKYMATEYLIKWREAEDDRIIVFSDNVFALQHYAITMKKPFIYGGTPHEERSRILAHFRAGHPQFKTIFLSKVGDTSLDLPEATCLIQISSQFGSRRQEAQRMGRILRAKRRTEHGFRSRFYTLVARDTNEVEFSAKRRRFLVDQGYEFKVVPNYETMIPAEVKKSLYYQSPKNQYDLLNLIQEQSDEVGNDEVLETGVDDIGQLIANRNASIPKKTQKKHALFKKWNK